MEQPNGIQNNAGMASGGSMLRWQAGLDQRRRAQRHGIHQGAVARVSIPPGAFTMVEQDNAFTNSRVVMIDSLAHINLIRRTPDLKFELALCRPKDATPASACPMLPGVWRCDNSTGEAWKLVGFL
jgi:hypothetical protein